VAKKGAKGPIFEGNMPPKKMYPQKWCQYWRHNRNPVKSRLPHICWYADSFGLILDLLHIFNVITAGLISWHHWFARKNLSVPSMIQYCNEVVFGCLNYSFCMVQSMISSGDSIWYLIFLSSIALMRSTDVSLFNCCSTGVIPACSRSNLFFFKRVAEVRDSPKFFKNSLKIL
jgi:hypothetical protein